jgi:hypothetical protein
MKCPPSRLASVCSGPLECEKACGCVASESRCLEALLVRNGGKHHSSGFCCAPPRASQWCLHSNSALL